VIYIYIYMTQTHQKNKGNTWQEDQDMPDAVDMNNPLVVAVPHPTPAGALAGTHAGLAPAHLVLGASGGRAALSLPSQVLLHHIMWHEEHNAAQNVLMQQLSGGKDKYASVQLHQTWLPNDPAVVGQLTSCGQVDSAFESNGEFAIYQYLVATRTSHKNAHTLLRIVTHPNFDSMALRFRSIEAYHCRVDALQQDGMLYQNMHEAIDGDQIVEFFFRQSVDVAKEIVSCATSRKHCTWTFTPTFEPTSGERTYGEFMAACWAELIEKAVGMQGRFICPFILGSDGESTFSCLCTLLCFRCARLGCRAPNFS